jgi:hypothetical protein
VFDDFLTKKEARAMKEWVAARERSAAEARDALLAAKVAREQERAKEREKARLALGGEAAGHELSGIVTTGLLAGRKRPLEDGEVSDEDDEVVESLAATRAAAIGPYKESDVFRVRQSEELSASTDPALERFKEKLMAALVPTFTDAFGLDPDTLFLSDMSANAYARGHHLLVHDDAMSARAVSFIYYVEGPDVGGALEVYSRVRGPGETEGLGSLPSTRPAAMFQAFTNRLMAFQVMPGVSHHAVGEVLAGRRISIQGWFHHRSPDAVPPRPGLASLWHLSNPEAPDALADEPFTPILGTDLDDDFLSLSSDEDTFAALDTDFFDYATACAMRARLHEEGAILLRNVLPDRLPWKKKEPEKWVEIGPSNKRRFRVLRDRLDVVQHPARVITTSFLGSPAFARFIAWLVAPWHGDREVRVLPAARRTSEQRFEPGQHYSTGVERAAAPRLSDDLEGPSRIECTLTMLDVGERIHDEYGGYDCCVRLDAPPTADDAVDVFAHAAAADGVSSVSAEHGALLIRAKSHRDVTFVKYLTAKAPSALTRLIAEFDLMAV